MQGRLRRQSILSGRLCGRTIQINCKIRYAYSQTPKPINRKGQDELVPLELSGCDIVPDLNGYTFETLPKALQIKLKRSFVRMEVIKLAFFKNQLVDIVLENDADRYRKSLVLIDALVNRRNSIAHGNSHAGVSKTEFSKWESKVQRILSDITLLLYDYANRQRYLKNPPT